MTAADLHRADRRPPALGGLNPTLIRLELTRLLRNRRTLIFTLVMPTLFFVIFGRTQKEPDAARYVLVSFAVYGAMIASTSCGAMVSIERARGWSRQLRLTPLQPPAYLATKLLTALVLGGLAVVVELAAGAVLGTRLALGDALECGVAAWLGSVVFAAFGLFVGYLLPSENVMQLIGPLLAVLAFLGGLFVPLEFLSSGMQTLATYTPVYGVGVIARYPLVHDGSLTTAVLNVTLWTAGFAVGAALLFRRDTARVG